MATNIQNGHQNQDGRQNQDGHQTHLHSCLQDLLHGVRQEIWQEESFQIFCQDGSLRINETPTCN